MPYYFLQCSSRRVFCKEREWNLLYYLDKFPTKLGVDELALRQVFLQALRFSPCHSTIAPHSSSTACRYYGQAMEGWQPLTKQRIFESRAYFHVGFLGVKTLISSCSHTNTRQMHLTSTGALNLQSLKYQSLAAFNAVLLWQ